MKKGGWGPSTTTSARPAPSFGPAGSASAFKPTYTKVSNEQKAKKKEIQVLQPGLVHLPCAMDLETQVIHL